MRRLICGLIDVCLLSSCSPGGFTELQRNVTLAAQQQLQRTLASHFTRAFGNSIDTVIAGLSAAGGFLDNPLVRVLLPPPLGLVLAVTRDFQADPQATVLEHLINGAAQAAIPGAGPVLRAALGSLAAGDAEALLQGGKTAATEFLMASTRDVLLETLGPVIGETLLQSGANDLYADALRLYELQKSIALAGEEVLRDALPEPGAPDVLMPQIAFPVPPDGSPVVAAAEAIPAAVLLAQVPPQNLQEYVTGKAVDGLFAALAEREQAIRREIDTMRSGLVVPGG